MPTTNQLVITKEDAMKPMALLNVADLFDNEYWRFCPDRVMDNNGRFLEDDEFCYDDFDLGPEAVLPAGTLVRMDHLWGWYDVDEGNTNFGGLPPATDFVINTCKTKKRVVDFTSSRMFVRKRTV